MQTIDFAPPSVEVGDKKRISLVMINFKSYIVIVPDSELTALLNGDKDPIRDALVVQRWKKECRFVPKGRVALPAGVDYYMEIPSQ